jgi:altronate dehydratase
MGDVVLSLSCILLPAFFFLSTSRCESWFSLSFLADSLHDNPMTGYASVCLVRREGAGLTRYSQSQSTRPLLAARVRRPETGQTTATA